MLAHADDFRSEGGDEETARAIATDWRRARLAPREAALCAYAEKATAAPTGRLGEADLAPLRAAGLSDAEIHDAVQVIAYFNYINRIADCLGTDPEPAPAPLPENPE